MRQRKRIMLIQFITITINFGCLLFPDHYLSYFKKYFYGKIFHLL